MDIIKIFAVFLAIIVVLWLKKPLFLAMSSGILVIVLLYQIPFARCLQLLWEGTKSWETLSVLLIFYLITFLQRILERRNQLKNAQQCLNAIFNNRRINATIAPIFIGLLPAAAAAKICAEIVDDAAGQSLETNEKAFVTSYYRHIPESFLPTYPAVIMMSQLSGVKVGDYVVGFFPMAIALFAIGWAFYVHKIPKQTGLAPSGQKLAEAGKLFSCLWSLLLIVVLILALDLQVYTAALISIVLAIFVYRVKPGELKEFAVSAAEPMLLLNTYLAMILKSFIADSGAISALPELFSKLPLPLPITFALLFFIGALISGSQAIIAMATTIAFSAIPGGGMPLMVLLHGFAYAAMQVAPMHICLLVVTDWFHTGLGGLVKKTVLPILVFCVVLILYYYLLVMLV